MRASSSAILRSSASRRRASASACARALRSSSVRVRNTTPDAFGAAAAAEAATAEAAGGAAAGDLLVVLVRFGVALRSDGATGSGLVSPPTRRLTFSTTTALLRPWLKLWRTTPCSTPPRFNVSVFVELTLSFSPLFLVVSVIPIRFCTRSSSAGSFRPSHSGPIVLIAGAKPLQAPTTRQKGLAYRAGEQGCMYHIWAVQCQIQLRRGQESNHRERPARPPPQGAIELADTLGGSLSGMQQDGGVAAFQCGFGLGEAGDRQAGLAGDSESIECGALELPLGAGDEIGREANLPLEAAGERFSPYGLVERFLRRRHPDAAAGQPALDVRHRVPFRPDHKPDQVRDRPHGARGDAQALGRARARSAVQFNVLALGNHQSRGCS